MNGYLMRQSISKDNVLFAASIFITTLVTHALAYLTHEYAHSLIAWLFGWTPTPLGIDYGSVSVNNLLFLDDVSDNVGYDTIFAAGHSIEAALIALAGPFLGNGLLYFVVYGLVKRVPNLSNRYYLMFLYCLSLMCAANVWSYVPIRTITTHADIALAARGFGISTWVLLPFVLAPSLFITLHFLTRMFPSVVQQVTGESLVNFSVFIAYTGFWYFSFFAGTDAIDGHYGLICQVLAIASRYLLFPLSVAYLSTYWRSRNESC